MLCVRRVLALIFFSYLTTLTVITGKYWSALESRSEMPWPQESISESPLFCLRSAIQESRQADLRELAVFFQR